MFAVESALAREASSDVLRTVLLLSAASSMMERLDFEALAPPSFGSSMLAGPSVAVSSLRIVLLVWWLLVVAGGLVVVE